MEIVSWRDTIQNRTFYGIVTAKLPNMSHTKNLLFIHWELFENATGKHDYRTSVNVANSYSIYRESDCTYTVERDMFLIKVPEDTYKKIREKVIT